MEGLSADTPAVVDDATLSVGQDTNKDDDKGKEDADAGADAERAAVAGIDAPEAQDVLLPVAKFLKIKVAELERIYGEGHRGAIAAQAFAPSDVIQAELARAYVAMRIPAAELQALKERGEHEVDAMVFFKGADKEQPYEQCPEALNDCLHAALTGILIRDDERLALAMIGAIQGEDAYALHGQVDLEHFPPPAQVYEPVMRMYVNDDAAKRATWTLDAFARLYGVVQSNANMCVAPFSSLCYGVGMFPGSVFFNHSCKPNAVAVLMPGKLVVQALEPIAEGEEITLAYQELPVDLLTPAMVRIAHKSSGIIRNNPLGCRCTMCQAQLEAEAVALRQAGLDPDAGRVIELDIMASWEENTRQRMQLDERFRAYAMCMFQYPNSGIGLRSARMLRLTYDHFLTPPASPTASKDSFCADLEFVLSDLYCRCVIHVPSYLDADKVEHEQTAEDYMWWTKLYGDLLSCSAISMPHALCTSLGARCYGSLLACGWYTRQEASLPNATPDEERLFPPSVVGAIDLALKYMPLDEWHAKCQTLSRFLKMWRRVTKDATDKDDMTPRESVYKALEVARKHRNLYGTARRRALLTHHQFACLDEFVKGWVGLRATHVQIFNHALFLDILERSYPLIARSVVQCNVRIADAERRLQLLIAFERQKQEQQAVAPPPPFVPE